MANIKNPLDLLIESGGAGWEYLAILGTDKAHNISCYKLYLHRQMGGWWLYEESLPMMTSRAEAPVRVYLQELNALRGPVHRFPQWLRCHPGKAALVRAVDVCRSLSNYTEEQAA